MRTVTALRSRGVVAAIESAPDAALAQTTLERIVEVDTSVAEDLVSAVPDLDPALIAQIHEKARALQTAAQS